MPDKTWQLSVCLELSGFHINAKAIQYVAYGWTCVSFSLNEVPNKWRGKLKNEFFYDGIKPSRMRPTVCLHFIGVNSVIVSLIGDYTEVRVVVVVHN